MIEGLKPYSEYKVSGSKWLGKVPSRWEAVPLGRLLVQRIEQNRPIKTKDILSLSLRQGVIPYSEKKSGGNKAKDDLSAYTLAYPGDIVLNSMNVVVGSVGLSKYFGAVSPVYYVLHTRSSSDSIHYFDALFQDKTFQQSLWGLGNGIMFLQSKTTGKFNTIRLRIPMGALRRVVIPHPEPDEQAAIVRFLEHANRKIDGFIRAKRKLITLLGEQKQAIIHRAVTRGLTPNAPLKPSGIPWLGDIPMHWEVRRAKYLFSEMDERSKTGKETHLAMSQRLGLVPSDMVESSLRSESYAGAKLCKEGDLVLNRLKAHLGVFALAKQGGVISPDYSVFRKRAAINMEYFESVLRSSACRRELRIRAKGIVEGFWRLYTDDFYDIRLSVPPIEEQARIMSAIATSTKDLNTAIARTEREIALMQEYRTRLTADVVTGKLDVRAAAARLSALPADAISDPPTDELLEETEAQEIP
jgi:type I restriction enzyme S subunit